MTTPGGEQAAFRDFGHGGLGHLVGLDGIRGLAVAAVVLFHGNWSWAKGGYLGVSLFFTLSGFLITSLLLTDHDWNGLSLREFWVRRFRRLLPAAWLTLAGVVVAAWWLLDAGQVGRVRLDLMAALANVANWRFLAGGSSYGDLFGAPSPVLHFWSLAIEEQFYLVFPLVVIGLMALTRGRRWLVGTIFGAGAVVSWFVPVLAGASLDRIYYGTDTRAGELLAGGALAVFLAHRRVRRRMVNRLWWRTAVATGGAAALGASVVAWVVVDRTSGLLTSGGLALYSLLSVLVIAAAAVPYGPVARLASTRPLVRLGRISYGVYLFHWPMLVFFDEQRTGLGHLPRFLIVVTASVALAEASYRFLEQPVRLRRGPFAPGALRPAALAPLVAVVIVAGALTMTPEGRRQTFDFASAEAELRELQRTPRSGTDKGPAGSAPAPAPPDGADRSPATVQGATTVPPPPPPAPRVATYGDSVMLSLALLLGDWEKETRRIVGAYGETELGCGIARYGLRRVAGVERTRRDCDDWATSWAARLSRYPADVVLVQAGQWELVDRMKKGDTTWRRMGDPVWDDYLRSELLAATDVLASRGSLVVWLTLPQFGTVDAERMPQWQKLSHQPKRVERLNQIVREVVAARPQTSRLIDLAGWMADKVNDTKLRADGVHFDWTDSNPVVSQFVGPEIVRLWEEVWNDLSRIAAEQQNAPR